MVSGDAAAMSWESSRGMSTPVSCGVEDISFLSAFFFFCSNMWSEVPGRRSFCFVSHISRLHRAVVGFCALRSVGVFRREGGGREMNRPGREGRSPPPSEEVPPYRGGGV